MVRTGAARAEAEQLATELQVSIIGRSKGKRIVIGKDYVEEKLQVAGRTFSYRQPEGAFTQPNGEVNQKMLAWAYDALGERSDDLLELYCGNGNFTLPLALRSIQNPSNTEWGALMAGSTIATLPLLVLLDKQ